MTDLERDEAELARFLAALGCIPDPEWNPPAGTNYVIFARAGVRQFARGRDRLLVHDDDGIIRWALMGWAGQPESGPMRYELFMHGEGPGGKDHPLREPRHTWFGPSAEQRGYLFYVQPKVLDWAFEQLREYFDFAGDEP